jgi:oligopeptide transport system substrate-binding protein
MYESTNAMNSSNYANEEYDALLADTRGTYANDPEKRWGALLAAE